MATSVPDPIAIPTSAVASALNDNRGYAPLRHSFTCPRSRQNRISDFGPIRLKLQPRKCPNTPLYGQMAACVNKSRKFEPWPGDFLMPVK